MTPLQIVNKALGLLGVSPISDFSDPSKKAELMSNIYPLMRDKTLEDADWTFATKRKTLTRDPIDPDWGYEARFKLPNEVIRVIWASNDKDSMSPGVWITRDYTQPSTDAAWVVEDGYILTQEAYDELYVIYIYRLEDTTKYSPYFVDALSYSLAIEACIPLTENSSHLERLKLLYDDVLDEAAMKDGSQGKRQSLWSKRTQQVR